MNSLNINKDSALLADEKRCLSGPLKSNDSQTFRRSKQGFIIIHW